MTSNQEQSLNNRNLDDEIDLRIIFNTLYKNKKFISKFSFSGFILGGLIAFTTKSVWQGEFQIVLRNDEKQESSLLRDPRSIAAISLLGGGSKADNLKTEVGILKSSSVLMNVFEFVKREKSSKNPKFQNTRFKDWEEGALDIELQKGTAILNLAYRDTDKDLILPVLNRISTTYQDYSGKNRLRNLELSVDYFKQQVSIYKNKSIESLRKAQQFAIDQDLSILKSTEDMDKEIPNFINVEEMRVKAANEIRFINKQLQQIENLKEDSYQLKYSSTTMNPELIQLSKKLEQIDFRLVNLRTKFKENDEIIQNLLKERIIIIDLLKKNVKGYLKSRKADAQALMKASERPEGVIIKYTMLLSEAVKDQATLNNLETQYRITMLEKARYKDPWELISTPTLLPHPVAPRRKLILALGLLGGGIIGSSATLLPDKQKKQLKDLKTNMVKNINNLTKKNR